MFDFLIRKKVLKSGQKYINGLTPKVQIHLHEEMPLPSMRLVKKLALRVSQINALEEQISQLSDIQLRAKTAEFKERIKESIKSFQEKADAALDSYHKSSSSEERANLSHLLAAAEDDLYKAKQKVLDEILNEAFAVVREAGKRVNKMRHFDVQLIGGMVLHSGSIAEMTTGEGKTLVATLPAYLNALTGDGVHVITVNDYLARRDRDWMGPVYEFLGLTVGVIQHDMMPSERQASYGCDITYGTNNEFGFDYLRDNMVVTRAQMVQRGHFFAIVDEVDSILVDEARTPLIISGPAEQATDKYYTANRIAAELKGRRVTEAQEIDAKHKGEDLSVGYDYVAEEKGKSISLTEQGEEKAAKMFGIANLHEMDTIEYRHHILQAVRAKEFFHLDTDYVVRDGQVIIVDEFTGRMMPGRRWSDGLHQAVEAKEGIKIERENQTLATITFQNYFRMYRKLAGMTGTAYTEANEFKQIYKLDVVVIPTNRALIRKNHPDCIYKTVKEKFEAVGNEIAEHHKTGQPVLVGTISIEKSERLSEMLKRKGIPHQVLNAKFHEMEANIIAQAGRFKAVTIATNMAGRGTDIVLGGNANYLAKALVDQKRMANPNQEIDEETINKFVEQFRQQVAKEHDQVVEAGGLHVIGTERHESRRIDNQLRGRSGRQGDPGSSRFYVSLEDDLMRLFAADRIMFVMNKLGMEDGQAIESGMVSGALETAQKRVENYNFEIRKQLLEYDNVMNKQREVVYSLRRSTLEGENLKEYILEAVADTVEASIEQFLTTEGSEGGPDLEGFKLHLQSKFNLTMDHLTEQLSNATKEEAKDLIMNGLLEAYADKEAKIGPEQMRRLERSLLLHVIDSKWKDHLYAMDHMKEGIGLRALGQRDPLIEYKKEGFYMFQAMYNSINQEVAEMIFKMQSTTEENQPKSVFANLPRRFVHHDFQGLPSATPQSETAEQNRVVQQPRVPPRQAAQAGTAPQPKVGRNDPCPCGSGKKYKKCCGA